MTKLTDRARAIDLAEHIDDLRKTIDASGLAEQVKAILIDQLRDAGFRFADANSEAKAAVFYMSRGTEHAANFVAAANDFAYAAQAARRAADAMKAAEVMFSDVTCMWDALNAE